jgi:hypothetical protein
MARSTEQVFLDHMRALANGDFPALMADYADDAVLMTLEGACAGKAEIAQWFISTTTANPNLVLTPKGYTVHGDVVLLNWGGEGEVASIPHGVDTFVIKDDQIRLQTVWFAVTLK